MTIEVQDAPATTGEPTYPHPEAMKPVPLNPAEAFAYHLRARYIDRAIRYARERSWCDDVNAVLKEVIGAETPWLDGRFRDLDGYDCKGFGLDGYNLDGYDRTGRNREGVRSEHWCNTCRQEHRPDAQTDD